MITLATLSTATAQEVFDQVANHLLTQKQQSVPYKHGSCLYRSDKGYKCAAGCLISDEEYKSEFEGNNWRDLLIAGSVPEDHFGLIKELQVIHDSVAPFNWPEELMLLAERLNLTYKSDTYGKV